MAGTTGFESLFGKRAEHTYFSPGRVNLLGEHTDYNDGLVMPMAVQLGNRFDVAMTDRSTIRIHSTLYGESIELDPTRLPGSARQHWSDYFTGVLAALPPLSATARCMDILVDSDLPVGSGLSSSASVAVGFALLLDDLLELGLDDHDIAGVAQAAENDFVGLACGILDPFAVLMGQPGSLIVLDCATMEWQPLPLPDDYSVLLADTGSSRSLASSGYNQRRRESERALSLLDMERDVSSLSELSTEDLASSVALAGDPIALRRARHVVTENGRVRRAADALKIGDLASFGALMTESHGSLRTDYEVSCDELDIMVEEALRIEGVLGAKLTGGGFGGAIVALVRTDQQAIIGETLADTYSARTDRKATIIACRPSRGACRIR